jgi:arylsulfatase A-like enzyme
MSQEQRYLDPMTGHGGFCLDTEGRRPNIVLISLDMVPLEFYLPAGGVAAPNLQGLRDRHLSFTHAYTTSPLCSPARAAYLTGRHSYITTNSERAHDGHEVHLRPDDIIFPEYLKAAGYHIRHVGKCHAGAEKFTQVFGENAAPWNRWSPPWHDDDGYAAHLRDRGLDRFAFQREIRGRDLGGSRPGNSYGGWIAPQGGKPFPRDATYPAYLVDRAVGTLRARPSGGQPFYLQLDFLGPHQPFAIPGGMEEREAEIRERMRLPASYRNIVDNGFAAAEPEPRVYSLYRRNWGLQDPDTVLDYRVANQLQFELMDAMIGRLFDFLRAENLLEDTWVFVLADHGEMNGESALVDKGAYLNPRVMRVPLLVKPGAGAVGAGTTGAIDAAVSLLDVAPTIMELAGIQAPTRLDGRSLLETLSQPQRPVHLPILFEIWSHVIPNPCVGTVFTGSDGIEYLYCFNAADPRDELYAIDADPMADLWGQPDAAALEHEAICVLHQRLSADPRWKSYRGFLELTYPQHLDGGGDRQLFI